MIKTVDKFEIPVQNVVEGLAAEEFVAIAVVGRKKSGGLYIASSTSTPATLELFSTAVDQINSGEFED